MNNRSYIQETKFAVNNVSCDVLLKEGENLFLAGEIQEAICIFQKCLLSDPEQPIALLNLGVCHFALGDFEKAEELTKQSLVLSPFTYEALSSLTSLYTMTRRCKLCGSGRTRLRYRVPGHYGTCSIGSCEDCGIYYLMESHEDHAEQIIKNSDVRKMAAGLCNRLQQETQDDLYQTYEEMSRNSFRHYSELVLQRHSSGRILDVGCGNGYFLTFFDGASWRRCGIDYNEDNHRQAIGKGIDAQRVDFKNFTTDENFNVVTMIEYIEHSPLPHYDIAKAYNSLTEGGLLLLATGNVESDEARNQKGNWAYFGAAPDHKYFFSPKTLSSLLEQAGFNEVQVLTGACEEKLLVLGCK